ncbi:MAG: ACT domain-containing protein [Bacillota bacterium]
MSPKPVTNIDVSYNVALITLDNLPDDIKLISDIFTSIASENINIDMVSKVPPYRGNVNISFSLPSEDLVKAITALNKYKETVHELVIEVDAYNTKVSVFGEEMKKIPGVAARLFTILANESIEIKLVTTSEVDISYLIHEKDVDKVVSSIKKEFAIE